MNPDTRPIPAEVVAADTAATLVAFHKGLMVGGILPKLASELTLQFFFRLFPLSGCEYCIPAEAEPEE